ncbi:MAG: insulinase family protein [Candidatus Eremiobacteraeota bacterium]|nr:insulinase family protein [Candidatus Eremiobacteraeota bacterium]
MMRFGVPLALAASLLLGAAPAPAQRYPQAFATDLGVTRLIAETDSDAPVGGVQIFVAAGLDRQPPNRSGVSALVAECVLATPIDGTPLRDAIAARGGSVSYTVDGRSVHYYLEASPDRLPAAVTLFGRALAAPDFSSATIAAARAALTERIDQAQGNALAVGIQMFRQSYYTGGSGMPALGMTTTIAQLGPSDVRAFYAATYVRSAITASAAGRTSADLGSALATLAGGLGSGPVSAVDERARAIPVSAPRIVAHRDVAAPWIVVGYAAPSPGSKDFGAMLVLQSLLAGAFARSSTTSLGFVEKSVGAFYLYDSSPASLVVYVNGSETEPTMALRGLLLVSRSLTLKPLGADALKRFKAAAEGQFLTDSVNLSDRSYLLGTLSAQGLGPDSINGALAALENTTPLDVQRVAKKYLQRYIVALVLPRQNQSL